MKILTALMLGTALLCAGASLSSAHMSSPTREWDAPSVGQQDWLVLLCLFADSPDAPHEIAYFEELFGPSYPNLEHYWETVSYRRMDFTAHVRGWYRLSKEYEAYRDPDYVQQGSRPFDAAMLTRDCQKQADPDVLFSDFEGIVYFFDRDIGREGYGGPGSVYFDTEVPYTTGMARMTDPSDWAHQDWAATPQGVIAHEMGHGMGFQHSWVSDEMEFGSVWDVMSDISQGCRQFGAGCYPVHPIAGWKQQAGWMDTSEVYVPEPGSTTTITLASLGEASLEPGTYRMARIPVRGSSSTWLTVEVRDPADPYDSVPATGVIIHRRDPEKLAYVLIDADTDGDSKDPEAVWTEGETFELPNSGIRVSIGGTDGSGNAEVTIHSPAKEKWRWARRVASFRASGHLNLQVQLSAALDAPYECLKNVALRLQRRVDGAWRRVRFGRFVTDATGYSIAHVDSPHRGLYRVVAPPLTLGWDVCERAVSARRWHDG